MTVPLPARLRAAAEPPVLPEDVLGACPFCGHTDIRTHSDRGDDWEEEWQECPGCGAVGPVGASNAGWNRRALPPDVMALLREAAEAARQEALEEALTEAENAFTAWCDINEGMDSDCGEFVVESILALARPTPPNRSAP